MRVPGARSRKYRPLCVQVDIDCGLRFASTSEDRKANILLGQFAAADAFRQPPSLCCRRRSLLLDRCSGSPGSQSDSGKVSKLTLATQRLPSMAVVVAVTQWRDRVKHKGKDTQGESENPQPRPRKRGLDGGWLVCRMQNAECAKQAMRRARRGSEARCKYPYMEAGRELAWLAVALPSSRRKKARLLLHCLPSYQTQLSATRRNASPVVYSGAHLAWPLWPPGRICPPNWPPCGCQPLLVPVRVHPQENDSAEPLLGNHARLFFLFFSFPLLISLCIFLYPTVAA